MSIYLEGYYPTAINDYKNFESWQEEWQMSEPEEEEEKNWIWFSGYYTEATVREEIKLINNTRA